MQKVTKAYRGVPAVKNVDFDLRKGEIHALLGENGAGKSTLTKIMAGVVEPTSGTHVPSRRAGAVRLRRRRRLHAGIAMVFQETSLVPSMTVAQNLYLGSEKFLNRLRGIYISAQQFLQSLNFPVDPTATVATLGAAKRQMVEIARAVHHNAEVIIFDEPTAALTPEEKRHFFALMRRLKARGVSIVFISHALEEALAHCRPHHHPARRRAGDDRRRHAAFDRDKIDRAPWSAARCRPSSTGSAARAEQLRKRRRQGSVGAGHLDGQRRAQQFLLDLSRARSPACSA